MFYALFMALWPVILTMVSDHPVKPWAAHSWNQGLQEYSGVGIVFSNSLPGHNQTTPQTTLVLKIIPGATGVY